ncbi:MAG: hypothetical protein WBA52_19085 [Dolichospermum sp.]
MKIFDDREAEYELLDDNYHYPIPEALRWRNWATDAEGITGDTLLDFVDNVLFKTLKDANTYQATAFPDVMRYKNPTPNPLPASGEGA